MGRGRGSWVRALGLIAVIALVAAGCDEGDEGGSGQQEAEPLRVGLLTDLTGPFKSFGSDIQTAVDLAVEEVNADGGINGSTLEVVVYDSAGDPQDAVVGIRELAEQDGVFAIIGPVSSGEAEVIFPQAAVLQVPILSGTANKEGLTDMGDGWAFRDTATNTQLYSAALPVFMDQYGAQKVVLAYDEQVPFAVAAAEFAIPPLAEQSGLEIVDTVTFQQGQTDFTSIVQRIGEAGADGALVMAGPVEGGLLCSEMSRQELGLPVLGHPAQNSDAFRESAGGTVKDWVVPSVFWGPSASAKAGPYQEAMAARDQEPPTVPEAANHYDIVYMIAQVARDAGIDGRTAAEEARLAIRDGLVGLQDFEALSGPMSFLPNGDVDKQVYTLLLGPEGAELLA